MTHQDNPFRDLPEWKERRQYEQRRAEQEGHARSGGYRDEVTQAPAPTQPAPTHHAPTHHAPTHHAPAHYPAAHDPTVLGQQPAAYQGEYRGTTYEEPAYNPGQVPYPAQSDQWQSGGYAQPESYQPDSGYPEPGTYRQAGIEPSSGGYRNEHLQHAPVGYDGAAGYGGQHADQQYSGYAPQSRDLGQHVPDQSATGQYGQGQHVSTVAPSGYDTGNGDYHAAPPSYDAQRGDEFWDRGAGVTGAALAHDPYATPRTAPHGGASDGNAEPYDSEADDEADDDERGFNWKLAVAVILTGAVVTGGGVVLYDSIKSSGSGRGGNAPIIKAEQGPAKTRPADVGGRQFANRDSKLLGRLDDGAASATSRPLADATAADNRVRTVPTVRIGRDGQLILPTAPVAVPAPEGSAGGTVAAGAAVPAAVPGVHLGESLGGGNARGLNPLPPVVAATQQAAVSGLPAVRPQRVEPGVSTAPAAPVIKNRGASANRATVATPEPPPVPSRSDLGTAWRMTGPADAQQPALRGAQGTGDARPQVARAAAAGTAAAATQAGASRRTASTPAAGAVASSGARTFVAVLATAPSPMRALQSFAELQQKHPTALQNRVPDVQRTDLKARGLGVMYRLVVGPAGSRDDANGLCASLKAEGYKGCWVKAN